MTSRLKCMASTACPAVGVCITATPVRVSAFYTEYADNTRFIIGSYQINNFFQFEAIVTTAHRFGGHFIEKSTNLSDGSCGVIYVIKVSVGIHGSTGHAHAFGCLNDGFEYDARFNVSQPLMLHLAVNFHISFHGVALCNPYEIEAITSNTGGGVYTILNASTGYEMISGSYSCASFRFLSGLTNLGVSVRETICSGRVSESNIRAGTRLDSSCNLHGTDRSRDFQRSLDEQHQLCA